MQFGSEQCGLETRTVKKGEVDQHQVGDKELCTPDREWVFSNCCQYLLNEPQPELYPYAI